MPNASKTLDAPSVRAATGENREFHSTIIPRSFQLGGLKIDVVLDNTFIDQHNCVGQAVYIEQKIIIDPSKTPQQTTEQAFVHELVHWIFYMMNEHELRNNERIVDCFAHFLYQALVTKEPLATAGRIARPRDVFEEIDYDPSYNNDNNPHDDNMELAQAEWEEEEESRREMEEEMMNWSGYADSWARSDEDGWFYDDED